MKIRENWIDKTLCVLFMCSGAGGYVQFGKWYYIVLFGIALAVLIREAVRDVIDDSFEDEKEEEDNGKD